MKFRSRFLYIIVLLSALSIYPLGVYSQRDAYDLVLSENNKAAVTAIIEDSKTISAESQTKLKDLLAKWETLGNNFSNLPKPLQDYYNKLNNAGLKSKLQATLNGLESYDAGLKSLMDRKAQVDEVINYYDRYRPDPQNPFRSLEVLNNLLTDAESLLPDEVEYEYIKNPTAWLIRVGLRYFKEGVSNALSGLRNVQKQIRDRAGNCIGYVGGDATADSSDPRRKAFTDMGTGDIICYTGIRPIGGEIWSNTTGANVFVWSSNKWTKLNCGLGTANNIFSDWMLAKGKAIAAERLIYWCNKQLILYENARSFGQEQFDKLNSLGNCDEKLLFSRSKMGVLEGLMKSVQYDRKLFTAKYTFPNDEIRQTTKTLTDIISNTYLFEGIVQDETGQRIANARVSIETDIGERTTTASGNGYFKTLIEIPENNQIGMSLNIKASALNYIDFETSSQIYNLDCMDLGILEMKSAGKLTIDPANSTITPGETITFSVLFSDGINETDVTASALNNSEFTGTTEGDFSVQATYNGIVATALIQVTSGNSCDDPNEIWDADINDCRCIDGYEKNELDECVKISANDSTVICTDPNAELVWDATLNRNICVCKENYITDPVTGLCVIDKNKLIAQADCSGVTGAVAEWDAASQKVICKCIDDYHVWDPVNKKCAPNVQAILDNSDCSQWPNTEPKWDYTTNEPYCDCISGYKWNDDYTECLSLQEQMVATTDCSHYPNTQPVWDPVNQEVICDCFPGYEWDANYTECISIAQSVVQNTDCSMYPNTEPVWDPVSEQAYCDCSPGYEWNETYTGCEKIAVVQQQNQQTQYDCSHFPNSQPVYDPVSKQTVCDCLPGYEWNKSYTVCTPIPKKPAIDWGSIIDLTVGILDAAAINNSITPSGYGSGNTNNSAISQPAVQHQSNCNDQQQAGGDAPEVHTIDLGQVYGSFVFDYQVFSVKDQIIVSQSGRTIFNSGCVSGSNSVSLNLNGFSSQVTVRVNPNCDGSSGTKWNFTVHCPNN